MYISTYKKSNSTNSSDNSSINIGLIGAGRIAEIVHLPLLSEMSEVKILAVYDNDLDRCTEMARKFAVPNVCKSVDSLLGLNIDVVIISTPNNLHATQSIMALKASKHVLCEKPMALNVKEAEAMVKASETTGYQLMIGFNNRFRTEIVSLYKAINSGHIGKIRGIECGWLRKNGIPGMGSWFTKREYSGGGVLIDIGSHIIDLALWLSGYPKLKELICQADISKAAEGKNSWYKPKSNVVDSGYGIDVETDVKIHAVFENSIKMSMNFSWNCDTPHDRTYFQIIGDDGKAEIDTLFGLSPFGYRPQKPLKIWNNHSSEHIELDGCENPMLPYTKQYQFFFDNIINNRDMRPLLNGSLAALRFVEDAYRSSFSNQKVGYD